MARGMVNGHLNPRYQTDSYPRDAPNRVDKGLEGGFCNRTACQLEHSAFCYNRVMNAFYRIRCAKAINEADPAMNLVNIPADYHEKWEAAVLAADEKESAKGVDNCIWMLYSTRINHGVTPMNQMTIECPFNRNYSVELDKEQVILDNPGEGTPAMVYGPGDACGTLYAAQDTGELACGPRVHALPDSVTTWLNEIDEEVSNFLY